MDWAQRKRCSGDSVSSASVEELGIDSVAIPKRTCRRGGGSEFSTGRIRRSAVGARPSGMAERRTGSFAGVLADANLWKQRYEEFKRRKAIWFEVGRSF